MRVAIQFFGHLRSFEKCFPYIKKFLLKYYDYDIFMHTWDFYNHSTKSWHTNFYGSKNKVDKERIKNICNITDEQIVVEHQPFFDDGVISAKGVEFSLQGLKAVQYSIKKVNKLRECYQKKHAIKYDCVICVRPDILLHEKLKLDKYVDKKTFSETIFFAGVVADDIQDFYDIGACDLLFLGSGASMSKLCNNLKTLVPRNKKIDHLIEGVLIDNITHLNLKKVFLGTYQCNDKFSVLRVGKIKRSDIISFHIRKNGMFLNVFYILKKVCFIKFNMFDFEIVISIGRYKFK